MCAVETCTSDRIYRGGLCRGHHNRLTTFGDVLAHIPLGAMPRKRRPTTQRTCEMDGCNRPHHGNGLCKSHDSMRRRRRTLVALTSNRTADGECLTCVDAAHLIGLGESVELTADRLGYTDKSLLAHLTRHGHESLVERINRVPWGVSA